MAEKNTDKDLFKDYVPEIMHYDPEVDGGNEHLIREDLLTEKERLKSVINKLKQKERGDRKVRR